MNTLLARVAQTRFRSNALKVAGASLLAMAALASGLFSGTAPAHAASTSSTTPTSAQNSTTVSPLDRGSLVALTSLGYVGYRYRFGGTSPSGFDCSGFVYYIYNHSGYPLPRDMGSQFNSGPRVSAAEMKPGDLVFFSNTYKRGLSHAGIYIGNGKFVNAANESVGVVVSDLHSSYWSSHFTAAVRPR